MFRAGLGAAAMGLLLVGGLPAGCFDVPEFAAAPNACDDAASCDNGDPCDGVERCEGGVCVAGTAVSCTAFDSACTRGVCEATSGACVADPLPDGSTCDDGLTCTDDACVAGQCTGILQPERCLIEDACYGTGAPHPTEPCLACDPTTPDAWSVAGNNPWPTRRGHFAFSSELVVHHTELCSPVVLGCDGCWTHPATAGDARAAGAAAFNVPVVRSTDGSNELVVPDVGSTRTLDGVLDTVFDGLTSMVVIQLGQDFDTDDPFADELAMLTVAHGTVSATRAVAFAAPTAQAAQLVAIRDAFISAYPALVGQVRFHLMTTPAESFDAWRDGLDAARATMVFHAAEGAMANHPMLLPKLLYARDSGLGVGIHVDAEGITADPADDPIVRAMWLTAAREFADMVYVHQAQTRDRDRLLGDGHLVHVDPSRGAIDGELLAYVAAQPVTYALDPAQGTGALVDSPYTSGKMLDLTTGARVPIADLGNAEGEGVLLSSLVHFGDLEATPGDDFKGVASKADSGGYALELNYLFGGTVQFAGRVEGDYIIADFGLAELDTTRPFWLIGAYSGVGYAYLTLDGVVTKSSSTFDGGFTLTPRTFTIGGAPIDAETDPHYLQGWVHTLQLHRWRADDI